MARPLRPALGSGEDWNDVPVVEPVGLSLVAPGLRVGRGLELGTGEGKMMEYDWDDENVDHIARHGVEPYEAEEVAEDPRRAPVNARGGRAGAIGMTLDGRLLVGDLGEKGKLEEGGNSEERKQPRAKGLQEVQPMSEERELIQVTDPAQVPEDMTETEAREFWDKHEITEEYIEKAGPPPEGVLPPVRLPTWHRDD